MFPFPFLRHSALTQLTDFVCSGRGATTGGGVSSSSSSSSLPDAEVAVPCLPAYNGKQIWQSELPEYSNGDVIK